LAEPCGSWPPPDASIDGWRGRAPRPLRGALVIDDERPHAFCWRFPLALCLGGTAVIALLLAIAVLAGQVAHGSATLAPPFLSSQPCVVVLPVIPAAVGLLAARFGRRDRLRSAQRASWRPPLPDR
jgi:hypothetical protein